MAHFLGAGSDNGRKQLPSPGPHDYVKSQKHAISDFRTYLGHMEAVAVQFAVVS